jgi:short-subunit dehydrogenase
MPSTVDTPIYANGANYIGKKIAPPVSVISPENVAQAIVEISKKPKKNVFVGKQTLLMRIGRFLMPTLFDKIVYYKSIIQEFQDEKVQKSTGNLYEPVHSDKEKISGGWQ